MFTKTKKTIVVKTYESKRVMGAPADAGKKFEKDAEKMTRDGYDIISVVPNDQKGPMSFLTGGVGLLAPFTLTVTYRLRG